MPKTPQGHHHIGTSHNQFEHIGTFLNRNSGDPATKVSVQSQTKSLTILTLAANVQNFLPKLAQHLLGRIVDGTDVSLAQTAQNPRKVLFKHDRIYPHNILRINYTTYDV